jgi:hypothetical protein
MITHDLNTYKLSVSDRQFEDVGDVLRLTRQWLLARDV